MKRLLGFAAIVALAAGSLHAQAVNATVCDVLKNPAAFDGKTVTIKGTVVAGFDQFVISDGNCAQDVNGIWLDYPQGSKAKAGPIKVVDLAPAKNFAGTVAPPNRAPVTLLKDKAFKQFDSALSTAHPNTGVLCLGCARYTVEATLTGRLDGVKDAIIARKDGKIVGLGGFGNFHAYPARLVIASIADVTQKEISYAATEAAVKASQPKESDQGGRGAQPGPQAQQESPALSFADAYTSATKLVAVMAPSTLTTQLQKDLAVLPKPKEQTSVSIVSGTANEVSAGEGAPGAIDSPDGLLYTITINRDRLPGPGVALAMVHGAQHVADVRSPIPGNEQAPTILYENNAWAVTVTLAIFSGEKTVTLPGGNLVWNSAWPAASQVSQMQSTLTDFLTKEEMFNK